MKIEIQDNSVLCEQFARLIWESASPLARQAAADRIVLSMLDDKRQFSVMLSYAVDHIADGATRDPSIADVIRSRLQESAQSEGVVKAGTDALKKRVGALIKESSDLCDVLEEAVKKQAPELIHEELRSLLPDMAVSVASDVSKRLKAGLIDSTLKPAGELYREVRALVLEEVRKTAREVLASSDAMEAITKMVKPDSEQD
jgi:hypothetical protein